MFKLESVLLKCSFYSIPLPLCRTITCSGYISFPVLTVTSYHKLNGLPQQKKVCHSSGSQKSEVWNQWISRTAPPPKTLEENPSLLFQLLVAPAVPWHEAVYYTALASYGLLLCLCLLLLCLFSAHVIVFRALDNPRMISPRDPNLVRSAKTLFPNMVTFTGSRE